MSYLMMVSIETYSCSCRDSNPIYVKRDIISSYVFIHVHHNKNRRNHKSLMIVYFYNGVLVPVLTHVILFKDMIVMHGLL